MKKPMSLSFTEVRSTRTISEDSANEDRGSRKVDLIHDDWFGLAPLASPESLSEISSISSRAASLGKLNLNSSIERVFHMASCQEEVGTAVITTKTTTKHDDEEEDLLLDDKEEEEEEEENIQTPVIMRRAIKVDMELSRCGDNWAEVEKYKRHGKVFVSKHHLDEANFVDEDTDSSDGLVGRPSLVGSLTFSRPNAQRVNQLIPNGGRKPFVEISCSSDSSSCASSVAGSSFRTATGQNEDTVLLIDFNSKSTEFLSEGREEEKRRLNASEEILGVRTSQGILEEKNNNKKRKVMTQSDSAILGGDSGAVDKIAVSTAAAAAKVTIMNSSSDTYHSATSTYSSTCYFKQEPITNKMASGVIESHFPVILDAPVSVTSSSSPLRSQVLLKATSERHGSNSPGRTTGNSRSGGRIPSVTIQYPQKPSPTHFNKGRKIYPAGSGTSTPKNFGHEESNV